MIIIIAAALIILLINFHPRANQDLSQDTAIMIDQVKATHVPLIQKYPERYQLLTNIAEKGFSNTQNYVLPNFMAQDYFKGYDDMNTYKALEFPKDHAAQLDFQFGWYFWSGNFYDENGKEVDVVVVFFRRAMYLPPIAAEPSMINSSTPPDLKSAKAASSSRELKMEKKSPASALAKRSIIPARTGPSKKTWTSLASTIPTRIVNS